VRRRQSSYIDLVVSSRVDLTREESRPAAVNRCGSENAWHWMGPGVVEGQSR
jgi:hypothetical protein